MQYWVDSIEDAQQPILMSSRDGKLLKPVPASSRLLPTRLQSCLEQVFCRYSTPHVALEKSNNRLQGPMCPPGVLRNLLLSKSMSSCSGVP